MRLIEIASLPNGAHRNKTPNSVTDIHDGWAVVPNNIETVNFPFGDVVVEEKDGVMTVVEWIPGIVPAPDPSDPIDESLLVNSGFEGVD